MIIHWDPSDSESTHRYRILLSILANLNNAGILMISVRHPISCSSNSLTQPLRTVRSATIIIATAITFIFHKNFVSLVKSRYLSIFSFSVIFTPFFFFAGMVKSTVQQVPCLIRHCNAVYYQNPIDRWMKGGNLPFTKKGWPRISQELLRYNTYIHSCQNLQCPTTKPHRTQNT